jgi:hypothetical protein
MNIYYTIILDNKMSDNNDNVVHEDINTMSDDEYEKSIQNIRTLDHEYMKTGKEFITAYYEDEDNAIETYGPVNDDLDTEEQVMRLDKIKQLITQEGSKLLHNAIYKNDFDNVRFLIKHMNADPTNTDKYDIMPVNIALKQKHFNIADYLLLDLDKSKKDNINIEDVEISLMEAVRNGWFQIIKLLINKIGKKGEEAKKAYINIQDNDGRTPLFYAVLLRDSYIVKILLNNEADSNIKDKYGITPLVYSFIRIDNDERYNPDSFIIEDLMEAGADPNLEIQKGVTMLDAIRKIVDNDKTIDPEIIGILDEIEKKK